MVLNLGDIIRESFRQKIKSQNTTLHMHRSHFNEFLTNYVLP